MMNLRQMFNRMWPQKEATPEIIEEFSQTVKQFTAGSLGYINIADNPPSFNLADIKDAFPNAQHLPAHSNSNREYILDENGKTIFLLLRDENGLIDQLYSPREKSELLGMMQGLKDKHPIAFNYFNDVYQLSASSATNPKIQNAPQKENIVPEPSGTVLPTEEKQRREEQEAEQRKERLMAQQEPFTYGWCYSDHKDGKKIRTSFRTTDYLQDEPYASSLKSMLDKIGLPEADVSQFFRGTHHELLFIESHGVVLKIGPTDIEDLIHPAILQPLGWMEDKENKLTVAIYPGVELYRYFKSNGDAPASAAKAMERTGQGTADISTTGNLGVVRINGNKPVQVAVDVDNKWNGTEDKDRKSKKEAALSEEKSISTDRSKAVSRAINDTFNPEDALDDWMQAFEVHQSLRHAYWKAFGKDEDGQEEIDPELMKQFWDECKQATEAPRGVVRVGWSKRINDNGVPIWTRHESVINVMALYTPWTGDEKDRRMKFAKGGELAKRQAAIEAVAENPDLLSEQPRKYRNSVQFVTEAININKAVADKVLENGIADRDMALGLYKEARTNSDERLEDSARVLKACSPELKNSASFWRDIIDIGFDGENLPLIPRKMDGYDDLAKQMVVNEPRNFRHLPSSVAGTTFIMSVISEQPLAYHHCPKSHASNPAIVDIALRGDPSLFIQLPYELREDRTIYDRVAADYPRAIAYAGEDIQSDLEALADAIELDANVYYDLSEERKKTKAVALAHIRHCDPNDVVVEPAYLRHLLDDEEICLAFANSERAYDLLIEAPEAIRDNREIVKACVERNVYAFEYASERLKADKELALKAIQESFRYCSYVTSPLAEQPDFMREAFELSPYVIEYFTPDALNENKDLFLELIQSSDVMTGMLPRHVLEDAEYRQAVLEARPDWKEDSRIRRFSENDEQSGNDIKLNDGIMRYADALRDAVMKKGRLLRNFDNEGHGYRDDRMDIYDYEQLRLDEGMRIGQGNEKKDGEDIPFEAENDGSEPV